MDTYAAAVRSILHPVAVVDKEIAMIISRPAQGGREDLVLENADLGGTRDLDAPPHNSAGARSLLGIPQTDGLHVVARFSLRISRSCNLGFLRPSRVSAVGRGVSPSGTYFPFHERVDELHLRLETSVIHALYLPHILLHATLYRSIMESCTDRSSSTMPHPNISPRR